MTHMTKISGAIVYYRRRVGVNAVTIFFRDSQKRRIGRITVSDALAATFKPGRSYTVEMGTP